MIKIKKYRLLSRKNDNSLFIDIKIIFFKLFYQKLYLSIFYYRRIAYV